MWIEIVQYTSVVNATFTCSSLNQIDPDVCSGNGLCVAQDTCECREGYYGDTCAFTSCYGKDENGIEDECSGHGYCLSYNNCSCEIGWYGNECDQYKHVYNPFQGYNVIDHYSGIVSQTPISFPSYYTYFGSSPQCEITALNRQTSLSREKTRALIGTASTLYTQFELSAQTEFTCNGNLVFRGGQTYQSSDCYLDGGTITFDGTDSIAILVGTLFLRNVNFIFTNCASYNTIFWKTGNGEIYGNFYGNLYASGYLETRQSTFYGTVILGYCRTLFESVNFFGFTNLDPYKPYLNPSCPKPQIGSCFNYFNTSSNVCSGHGKCIREDQCECNYGYYGTTCEFLRFRCYGYPPDDPSVCSGKGDCMDTDICQCQPGYYGRYCETTEMPSCNSILRTDPNVCNGRGECVSEDDCRCRVPYLDYLYCEYSESYNCFNLDRLDPTVCSGNGNCTGDDQCVCDSNHFGSQCENFYCNEIESSDGSVCSGKGICVSVDKCICSIGATSKWCDETKQFYNPFQGYNMIVVNSIVDTVSMINLPGKLYAPSSTSFSGGISAVIKEDEYNPSGLLMSTLAETVFYSLSDRNSFTIFDCSANELIFKGGMNYEILDNVCQWESKVIIIDGYEDILIKAKGLILRNVSFEFRNCSSSYNIYWKVERLEVEQYSVMHGNIRVEQILASNTKFYGTLFLPNVYGRNTFTIFGTCTFMNFTHMDPYIPFIDSKCNSSSPPIVSSFGWIDSISNSSVSSNSSATNANSTQFNTTTTDSNSTIFNSTNSINNTNLNSTVYNSTVYNSTFIDNSTLNNSTNITTIGPNNTNGTNSTNTNGTSVENTTLIGNSSIISQQSNNTNTTQNETTTNVTTTDSNNTFTNQSSKEISMENNSTILTLNNTLEYNNTNNSTINNTTNESTNNSSSMNTTQIEIISNSTCNSGNSTFQDGSNSTIRNETLLNEDSLNSTSTNNDTINESTNNSSSLNTTQIDMVSNSTVMANNFTNNSTNNNTTNESANNSSSMNTTQIEIISNSTSNYGNSTFQDGSNSTIRNDTLLDEDSLNSTIGTNNCDRVVNCSNHGNCNSQGQCICHSNDIEGYWSGSNCQVCEKDFYGKLCNTKIVGPALISPDFKGVTFILHSPQANDSIPCEKIINPLDLAIFGSMQSNVKCQFSDRKNDIFLISFGSMDFSFTPGNTTIQINTQAFENIIVRSTPKYISLVITIPETVEFSQAVITMPNVNQYSSCATISADGSSSYSFDGRSLTFYWFLLDSNMNILNENYPNEPTITLKSYLKSGSYRIGLKVKSNFLNSNSSLSVSSIFNKTTSALPLLSVDKGETVIEKYSNEFPITLKKFVTDSPCKSSTDTAQIEWSQIIGPIINTTVDHFNNLYIPKLTIFGNQTYIFRVSVFYRPTRKVSLELTLRTKSPELQLNILQVETLKEFTSLQIDFVDPEAIFNEKSSEIWKWTSDDQSPSLMSRLQELSNSKSVLFSISSDLVSSKVDFIVLALEITKGDGRSIKKSTIVRFSNIPPLVNIVSIEPASPVILPGQVLTIQTLTSSNSSNSTFMLNGKVVEYSSIVQQSESTNTISIDSSALVQGSINSLTIFTYDTNTGLSTQTSYTFQVASPPRVCSCSVYPKEGIALATDFSFYCENCKTSENDIDYRYGFIDDRSQSKIVMYNLGEVYSTKLPSPFTGTSITCFFDIVNKTTGAFTTAYANVTIYKPFAKNMEEIQIIVQQWEFESMKYFIDGDFSKSVYQSASTSRTDSVFLKEAIMETLNRRESNIICQNGVDVSGECNCKDGWIGKHCELSISDFSNIQRTKISILKGMIFVVNNTDGMKDEYVSLLSFAIDSLLVNYPYLDTNTISESLSTLNLFLDYALSDDNVRVSGGGVDFLLSNCIEFAYKYILKRQYVIDQTTNSDNLHTALKKSFLLLSRSSLIGSPGKLKNGPFFSAVLKRNTIYDFPKSIFDPVSKTKVVFAAKFLVSSTKTPSIVGNSFMSVLTVSGDIFSLNTRLQISQKNGNTATFSKLISPIVSIDFSGLPVQSDGSKISYMIPYNITQHDSEGIALTNFEYADKVKTISCGDFRNGSPTIIRSDCTLQSRNGTHLVCSCNSFTNVFAMETTVVTYHSYVYVVIFIVISILVSGLVLVIILGVIMAIVKLRRKFKKDMTISTDTHSSFSLRVQEIDMESFYGQTPVSLHELKSPQAKERASVPSPQSSYHVKRKTSQVVPLRIDLMDEKYCDNLSSNGSEHSQ